MTEYSPILGSQGVQLAGGTLEGLAYPERGPRCCALELGSGGRVVRAARADKFSELAAGKGLRDGWCGFAVAPRAGDFIFSDQLVVRCAVSGAKVAVVEHDEWARAQAGRDTRTSSGVSVTSLLASRSTRTACDPAAYWRLLDRTTREFSDRVFVEQLYMIIVDRPADEHGLSSHVNRIRAGLGRRGVFDGMIGSEEFTHQVGGRFLSPFSQDFPIVPKLEQVLALSEAV